MRRLGFVFTIVTVLMSACSKDVNISGNDAVDQPVGEVSISLSSVDGHQIVTPLKSVVDVPDPNAFEVEIYNSKGIRLYRDTYGNSIGRKIPLNAGDYRLLAQYGDSLGVGFDVVYFAADHNFTVHGQTSENVEAVARMANVKVAVNFGDNLKQFYPEHYARVKHPSLSEYLQFNADETRAGYIPAENLTLEIYAEVDGTWKYYKAPAVECAPNDFITSRVIKMYGILFGSCTVSTEPASERGKDISSPVIACEPSFPDTSA